MITICFVNQKGGVGKTTSVMNIGACLAKLSKRVLMIDLDPQESLSYWLGITEPDKTIFDFFDGKANLESCITRHAAGFDVVPSKEMLATITPDVYQLKQALDKLNYDFVLLDCSPTLGMTSLAALTAANWVIIPLCPDLLSIKGMSQLLGTIQTIREQTNPGLLLKNVLATRYDGNQKMHRDVLEQLTSFLDSVPIFTVREDIAVSESPVAGMSVVDYKPDSAGAQDYMAISQDLANSKGDYKTAVASVLAKHSFKAEQKIPNTLIGRVEAAISQPLTTPKQKEMDLLQTVSPGKEESLRLQPLIAPAQQETDKLPILPPQQEEPVALPPLVTPTQQETKPVPKFPSEEDNTEALQSPASPVHQKVDTLEIPSNVQAEPSAATPAMPSRTERYKLSQISPNPKRGFSLGMKASVILGLIVAATAIAVFFVQSSPLKLHLPMQRSSAEQSSAAQSPAAEQPSAQQSTPSAQQPTTPKPPAAPEVKPEKVILKGVQFDYDKDTLQPQSYPILDDIVNLAKQNPQWQFRLTGHTDSWGDDAYNLNLSLRRVQAVKYYLVKQGVPDNRLIVVGKGRSERLTTNDTAEGRAQNRRVEMEIIQ
ncbi:MAG: OmpA/MotB domain protein [Firmicutes bacterium]|nr:OmpA/MotB domain protein [Bacillota bacterium]